MTPYYADHAVTLYLGDCREVTAWLAADVLVTDPPYGRAWANGDTKPAHQKSDGHSGIAGDADTTARDDALTAWCGRPAIVFGDLTLPPPTGTKLAGVFQKAPGAGFRGAVGGFRRDAEGWYLLGAWPSGLGGESSVITTGARVHSIATASTGHPHTKPLDVMETLLSHCPPGVIADPFAGSGSTLLAARNSGRQAIGVEIDERYCETIAKRLDQLPLFEGGQP